MVDGSTFRLFNSTEKKILALSYKLTMCNIKITLSLCIIFGFFKFHSSKSFLRIGILPSHFSCEKIQVTNSRSPSSHTRAGHGLRLNYFVLFSHFLCFLYYWICCESCGRRHAPPSWTHHSWRSDACSPCSRSRSVTGRSDGGGLRSSASSDCSCPTCPPRCLASFLSGGFHSRLSTWIFACWRGERSCPGRNCLPASAPRTPRRSA